MSGHLPTDAALAGLRLDPRARHVPAWMYVQDAGPGLVSFVGASRVTPQAGAHPLRYGSERTHQMIVGEFVLRPHYALATDALIGTGLGGIAGRGFHDLDGLLDNGELLFDPYGRYPGTAPQS
ncbi:hypothetical protein [Streptomyces kronopolitis]|uniref:hypothetical protein n=1 Tax=Streptomyces kronopolitis TaxID=1612435 RepID=UPI003D969D0C